MMMLYQLEIIFKRYNYKNEINRYFRVQCTITEKEIYWRRSKEDLEKQEKKNQQI